MTYVMIIDVETIDTVRPSWAARTGVLDWDIALPRLLEAWKMESAEG